MDVFTAAVLAELKWVLVLVQADWLIVMHPPGVGFFLNISTLPLSPCYGPWDCLQRQRGRGGERFRDGVITQKNSTKDLKINAHFHH